MEDNINTSPSGVRVSCHSTEGDMMVIKSVAAPVPLSMLASSNPTMKSETINCHRVEQPQEHFIVNTSTANHDGKINSEHPGNSQTPPAICTRTQHYATFQCSILLINF